MDYDASKPLPAATFFSMNTSNSHLPTTTAYPSYRFEDWIDTASIPNDSFAIDASVPNISFPDLKISSNTGTSNPSTSTALNTSSDVSFLPTDNSLNQGPNATSVPGSYPTGSNGIAHSEEQPPVIDTLTISTAFQETPNDPTRPAPDIILMSSDGVVFYVDQETLLKGSNNNFNGLLPVTAENKIERVRNVYEVTSSELNIILHILYNVSCAQYNPSSHLIISSIDHLPKFGITPKAWISKTNPIYNMLLPHTPVYPLDLYCLCGRHDMYDLARVVSPHLLSFELSSLTDEDAEKMGSVYLCRLFQLHRSRVETLMNSLMPPPVLHNPTKDCGFEAQKTLTSAWTMVVAYLSWCAKPDMPTSSIRSIFASMTQHITCRKCLKGRDDRVNKIVVNWTLTPNTIQKCDSG